MLRRIFGPKSASEVQKEINQMLRWLSIVQAVTPLILAGINPALGVISGLVIHAVSQVEMNSTSSSTHAEKKTAAMQIVSDGIEVTNIVAGKTIIPPEVMPDVSSIIDNVVTASNQLHAKSHS